MVTYNWSPVSVVSVAVEVYISGLRLPHVAEPKVDAVRGQTQCWKIHMGTERHCLNRAHKMKLTFWDVKVLQLPTNDYTVLFHFLLLYIHFYSHWPAGYCCYSESGGFAGMSASSAHLHCGLTSPQGERPHLPAGLLLAQEAGSSWRPLPPGI